MRRPIAVPGKCSRCKDDDDCQRCAGENELVPYLSTISVVKAASPFAADVQSKGSREHVKVYIMRLGQETLPVGQSHKFVGHEIQTRQSIYRGTFRSQGHGNSQKR